VIHVTPWSKKSTTGATVPHWELLWCNWCEGSLWWFATGQQSDVVEWRSSWNHFRQHTEWMIISILIFIIFSKDLIVWSVSTWSDKLSTLLYLLWYFLMIWLLWCISHIRLLKSSKVIIISLTYCNGYMNVTRLLIDNLLLIQDQYSTVPLTRFKLEQLIFTWFKYDINLDLKVLRAIRRLSIKRSPSIHRRGQLTRMFASVNILKKRKQAYTFSRWHVLLITAEI